MAAIPNTDIVISLITSTMRNPLNISTDHPAEGAQKSNEGGILSGHGPLDSPLSRFLVQVSLRFS